MRNLEVIGEAVRQIPVEYTTANPTIPWQRIAGLRNRIVHGYFGLDLEIIWQILQTDLPALRSALATLPSLP